MGLNLDKIKRVNYSIKIDDNKIKIIGNDGSEEILLKDANRLKLSDPYLEQELFTAFQDAIAFGSQHNS